MPEGSVAHVEDWDSDESAAVPGTAVHAERQAQRERDRRRYSYQPAPRVQPSSSSVSRPTRAPASDSGYSSLTAKSPVKTTIPAQSVAPQQDIKSPSRKSKPILHPGIERADSAHSTQQRSHPVPAPAPAPTPTDKQRRKCSDVNCRNPNCGLTSDARCSQSRASAVPAQYATTPSHQHPQMNAYTYSQMSQAHAAAMMPPPTLPMQRPRTVSTSRPARPVSIHGYPPGPPPSQSAYYGYPQSYVQPPPQLYTDLPSASLNQMASFTPISAVPPSPTSPSATYPGYPGYSGTLSARQANPAVPGLEMPRQMPKPGLTRTMSARQRTEERPRRQAPALLPDAESTESDSTSESESDSDGSSEHEYRRSRRDPRRRSYRKEDTIALVHNPRRPSMNRKSYTEASLPTRSRRESMSRGTLQRAPRSDTFIEYQSSSDVGDSDRTARAVVDRRSTFSSGRSSRRPSVSTTASSGRTKATTMSSVTDGSRGQMIVEAKNGRQTAYLSKEAQARLRYRQQQMEEIDAQRDAEEKVRAYQKNMGNVGAYDLTAENVKKANYRKSGSHISHRSQRSGGSSSKISRPEGIQIKSGDTVLHVYGDAKIEMRPGEDGGPAQFVIGSSNGRESEYRTSSKSSGSRVGRSRARTDLNRRVIRETSNDLDYEDGYEVGR